MKSRKKPVVILDIDQTLFDTKLFKERLYDTTTLSESEYIELLYLTEKKLFQELVMKREIPINIFSVQEELRTTNHKLNDTEAAKRLKDYLEDYKDYQIYLVDDQLSLLKEAKNFSKDIITILLQTNTEKERKSKTNFEADNVIRKLEEMIQIIVSN